MTSNKPNRLEAGIIIHPDDGRVRASDVAVQSSKIKAIRELENPVATFRKEINMDIALYDASEVPEHSSAEGPRSGENREPAIEELAQKIIAEFTSTVQRNMEGKKNIAFSVSSAELRTMGIGLGFTMDLLSDKKKLLCDQRSEAQKRAQADRRKFFGQIMDRVCAEFAGIYQKAGTHPISLGWKITYDHHHRDDFVEVYLTPAST